MIKKGTPVLVLVLLLAWLLAACATPTRSEHDPGVDFDRYQSFAWTAPRRETVRDPVLDSELLDRRVAHAVRAILKDRGYQEVDAESADFLITYHTVTRERLVSPNVRVHLHHGPSYRWHPYWHPNYHPHPFFGPPVHHHVHYVGDTRVYREGSLIVDVIDRERGELIWRGWRASEVRQERFRDERLKQLLQRILADFPPGF
ncbi:DUF4136 domain-containing protein [Gammaproteobacteria bacterium AB-CW1]|uniref:DUF4136 domain-containing protein n=1 Tax=Natronospira elongata TaxID=3110268 RepID=A0AAP6JFU5_9GAMM|nr:DUF4136 domain-containing protein [Gammaproteobacteria bacterium AB-CW1]